MRSFNLENEVNLINGLTGIGLSNMDLFETGEKIASFEKLFNIRHAKKDIEDKLPEMFFSNNSEVGLTMQNFEIMLTEYYNAMGWDEKGIPPEPV